MSSKKWSSTSLLDYFKTQETSEAAPKHRLRRLMATKTIKKEDFFPIKKKSEHESKRSRCVLHPENGFKLSWDVSSMFLIFYQAISIPYLLAFEVDDYKTWAVIDLFITGFFTIDIFLTFNTSYYHGGSLITSRRSIAKNYIRSWFWLDFLTTFPYDLIINQGDLEEKKMSEAAQLLRILKFYRILRLVRLLKLKKILIEIEDYVSNYTVITMMIFFKLVIFAFFIAHWIACLWYYIGNSEIDQEPETWLSVAYMEEYSNYEIYITALYWAFTTMTTVGYGDIFPVTEKEYIYCLFAMAVSCAMFAYIVSSIGGLVSKHTAEKNAHREQVVAINAYMKEKKFPQSLRFRVRRYLDYIWEYQKNSVLAESEILALLSEPLREEIFVETRGQTINICPIFQNFNKLFLVSLTKLLEPATFAPGDIIFEEREHSNHIYFIQSGTVELYHHATQCIYKELEVGQYFGEIAFFTKLPRQCSANCQDFVEVLMVSRERIEFLLEKNSDAKRMLNYYASECAETDLSSLMIECYFCKEIGHVAAMCPLGIIEINDDKLKQKWLHKKSSAFPLNPHEHEKLKERRKIKKTPIKAANVVGEPRDPAMIYKNNSPLACKVSQYLEEDFEQSFSDSMNSSINKTKIIISNLDDFFDDDQKIDPGSELMRPSTFNRHLITSRSSLVSQPSNCELGVNPQDAESYNY